MAQEKKLVEAITSMSEDFAQWYTDVVVKADLIAYSSVKGTGVISLTSNSTKIVVSVTAANGNVRDYNITINKTTSFDTYNKNFYIYYIVIV